MKGLKKSGRPSSATKFGEEADKVYVYGHVRWDRGYPNYADLHRAASTVKGQLRGISAADARKLDIVCYELVEKGRIRADLALGIGGMVKLRGTP